MRALEVDGVDASYGLVQVLRDVSLHVEEGEIVSLIGPNGAGKSTLLNVIAGAHGDFRGRINLYGERLDVVSQGRRVRRGVALVPEGREVFAALTVEDNLKLGAFSRRRDPEWLSDLDDIYGLFPRLKERRRQIAGTLSGGEQQMLAIGRALMSSPRCLLLDEPSLGLAPQLVSGIFSRLAELRERGMTVLLVEQNARAALRLADRAYLLETGEISVSGAASDLAQDPHVQSVYLGSAATSSARGSDDAPASDHPSG